MCCRQAGEEEKRPKLLKFSFGYLLPNFATQGKKWFLVPSQPQPGQKDKTQRLNRNGIMQPLWIRLKDW